MTDKLSRDTWMICAALHLHLTCKWELQEAAKYAQVMAEVYYDDPEYHNEDGERMTPAEAIQLDMEYWET